MSNEEIQNEWDAIAYERLLDLLDGKDVSYESILKPNMIAAISKYKPFNTLDAGCGVGVLTKEAALVSKNITAIDISKKSIDLAKEYCGKENIKYINSSIEDFSSAYYFDVVYSNMVLMDVPDPSVIIKNIFNMLKKGGMFLFTITHPTFWPIYWRYNNDQNFKYTKEYLVRREFATRLKKYNNLYTRHYHRPLQYYINTLISSGFSLERMSELSDVESTRYWYPRFILLECKKQT